MWSFLFLIAVVGASLVLYRRSMISRLERGGTLVRGVEAFVQMLEPGDIVYMASRRLGASFLHSTYALLAAAYMGTPLYHAFLVLPNGRMGHFVHEAYEPRLEQACSVNQALQFGSLSEYVKAREKHDPVYMVFRHPTRPLVDIESKMRALCDRRFPTEIQIGLSLLGLVYLDPEVYAHCNSYIGVMLARDGYLVESKNPHREYIPVRLITEYLPRAGFRVVKTVGIALR